MFACSRIVSSSFKRFKITSLIADMQEYIMIKVTSLCNPSLWALNLLQAKKREISAFALLYALLIEAQTCPYERSGDIIGFKLSNSECLSFISVNNEGLTGSGDELEIYNNFCSTHFKGGHVARLEVGIAFPRSMQWLRNHTVIRVYSGVQLIGTELTQYEEEFGWFQIDERPFLNFQCSENPIRYATWLELPVSVVFRCVHPLKIAFQIFLYRYWSSAWIRDYSLKIEKDDKLFRQLTGYPKCRLLLIQNSGHISFTELQPCRDAKWSHFACRHYASMNCRRERLQLCHSSNLFEGCKSFAYKTVQQPEAPYGHSCERDNNGPSCHCPCAASAWSQWTAWSSTCGIAERFRKGAIGNGTAKECDRHNSTCCHQMERKVYNISCSSYIFNTGIHILNDSCLNNGTITKHWQNGVFCKCPPLFTGAVCDTKLDPCESKPCLNKGRCEIFGISFFCLCSPGHTGRRCERQVAACDRLNNNCLNGGTCVEVNKKNSCACTPKFTGVLCEHPIDGCAAIHCMNDGTCLNVSDGFRCICKPYFKGTYCEQIDIVRPKKHSGYFPAQDPKLVMFATLIATVATFVCCFVGTVAIQQTKNGKQDTEDDEQLADIRLAQSGYDSYS